MQLVSEHCQSRSPTKDVSRHARMLNVCKISTEGKLLYKVTMSQSTNYIRRVWQASIYAAETQQQLRESGVMPNRKVEKTCFCLLGRLPTKSIAPWSCSSSTHGDTPEMKWLGASEHSDHDAFLRCMAACEVSKHMHELMGNMDASLWRVYDHGLLK